MFNDPNKKFPGPGAYKVTEVYENRNGHYVISRYKSPGCAIISRQGKRFDHSDMRRS
jgi:hypothetical protein